MFLCFCAAVHAQGDDRLNHFTCGYEDDSPLSNKLWYGKESMKPYLDSLKTEFNNRVYILGGSRNDNDCGQALGLDRLPVPIHFYRYGTWFLDECDGASESGSPFASKRDKEKRIICRTYRNGDDLHVRSDQELFADFNVYSNSSIPFPTRPNISFIW